jgi:hypothetical protein
MGCASAGGRRSTEPRSIEEFAGRHCWKLRDRLTAVTKAEESGLHLDLCEFEGSEGLGRPHHLPQPTRTTPGQYRLIRMLSFHFKSH